MDFQIVKDSFEELDDGSFTCSLKCPVLDCNETCPASYKSYRSYYKAKKKSSVDQRPSQPRWHLYAMEKHIRQRHIQGMPDPNSGNDSVEKTSPDLNGTENQIEDSSNELLNSNRGENAHQDAQGLLENDENHGRAGNSTSSLVTDQTERRVTTKRAYPNKITYDSVKRTRSRK